MCTYAANPLQRPFHWADKSQLVMQENGMNPSILVGIVVASERSSRNLNSGPNSVKVSFVSQPIIIFNGRNKLCDCANKVAGLSRSGHFVKGHRAATSVILIPPAIIERFLDNYAPSIEEATDKLLAFPIPSR